MDRKSTLRVGLVVLALGLSAATASDYQEVKAVAFTEVKIADAFWAPRIETNRVKSIPHNFKWCRQTGRFSNFAKAGKLMEGGFQGIYFNDSDVYKVLEGAAYSLQAHPDPKLEKQFDEVLAWIAAAQQDNGYLNTYYTLKEPNRKWTNCRVRHELYCAGHMFEAAVAHHRATGKKTFLDVATKFADRIDEIFGPEKRHDVPGHEEIELALVKLYRLTGEERYLKLARFFLDIRGKQSKKRPKIYGPYCQDHQPVTQQSEPTGHAVRAMYLYAGMADVAAITGEKGYIDALGRLWENTVTKKMYVTGAIGSTRHGEAFGKNYQLPNETAYGETCASIGMCLWNHRMNLLHADGRYADTFERTLYNGLLAGVDLGGEKFFYVNPLASWGRHHRQPFYGCACCPTNVARFMPSLPGYVYAVGDDRILVNLYATSRAAVKVKNNTVRLSQVTRYPWDGEVKITVSPKTPAEFDVSLRIPAWCVGVAGKDDLYQPRPVPAPQRTVTIEVNGRKLDELRTVKGYARIRRKWQAGDEIQLSMPMPIRRVRAHPSVEADVGRVAIQRGPIVYCIEAVDNGPHVASIYLPAGAELTTKVRRDLLGGIVTVTGQAMVRCAGEGNDKPTDLVAIPYYAWDHREGGAMMVWIAEDRTAARPRLMPTLASESKVTTSHLWRADKGEALNDQIEPKNSNDHDIPRFTWWDHRGTKEWVQYTFKQPQKVAGVEVYWFNDKPRPGQCRQPKSWRLMYQAGDAWKPVPNAGEYTTDINKYNKVTFDPVETTALRIEVELQPNFSGGVLEWRVGAAP